MFINTAFKFGPSSQVEHLQNLRKYLASKCVYMYISYFITEFTGRNINVKMFDPLLFFLSTFIIPQLSFRGCFFEQVGEAFFLQPGEDYSYVSQMLKKTYLF